MSSVAHFERPNDDGWLSSDQSLTVVTATRRSRFNSFAAQNRVTARGGRVDKEPTPWLR